jgi:LPXTG-motif cell wall-anchored protein
LPPLWPTPQRSVSVSTSRPSARWGRRLLLLGTLTLGTMVSTAAGPVGLTFSGPVGADPLTSCSTTVGVVTAVDFSPWNMPIERGCDGSVTGATTAYQALLAAGFTPAGDEQDGPAFVCLINGFPTDDPCTTTPSASAYWSFWVADAGQDTWTYSQYGAMSYHPPPGSVDAWSFGSGGSPSFTPSTVAATNTEPVAPAPTPTTTPTTSAVAPTTTVAAPSGGTTGPAGGRSVTATTTPLAAQGMSTVAGTATTTTPTASAAAPSEVTSTTISTERRGHPKVVDVIPSSSGHRPSTGSPVPAVVGAGLVVLVAGGGGLIAWRRRRAP